MLHPTKHEANIIEQMKISFPWKDLNELLNTYLRKAESSLDHTQN